MALFRFLALFAVLSIVIGCGASVPDNATLVPTATPEPTPFPTSTPTPIPAEDLPEVAESFYKRAAYVLDLYQNCRYRNRIDRDIERWASANFYRLVNDMKVADNSVKRRVVDSHPEAWWKRALPELELRLDAIENACGRR